MEIGKRLRGLRDAHGVSQGDIEKRPGLACSSISHVENRHATPTIETLGKSAHALEVIAQDFADWKWITSKIEDGIPSKDSLATRFTVSRDLLLRFGLGVLAILCFAVVRPRHVLSYKLSPAGTALEKSIAKKYSTFWQRSLQWVADRGVHHFSEPVHEEITNRMFGCQGERDVCGDPNIGFASPFVLAGVRWNDDPPFRLEEGEGRNTSCKITETIRFTTQPRCWAELFRDAKKKAAAVNRPDAASHASLLARSHFGDLQFLHAMASEDGELAVETKRRIMMWAEFTWKVSRGDYGLETKLKDVSVAGFDKFFGGTDWRVQDLFTLGNVTLRPKIEEVALGSLLHMVQDSFPKGHVDRAEATLGATCPGATSHLAPGAIREFHSYIHQDPAKHGDYDSRNAFVQHWVADRPTVIDVGQVLLDYQKRGSTWEDIKPYIDCVFALENPEAKASAGAAFKQE